MQQLQPNTTLQGGKYRIDRVLGQGGFGITYLAIQVSSNRKVAIKELFLNGINERSGNSLQVSNSVNDSLFEKQKEKFKKEAKRIKSLDNEHIVKVYDLFEENNTVYYVMDYLEGESLASKMKREGHPLTESEVMDILPQLLDALSEIHKYQIWHLDIKPANIMLIDKNVVLIDFGASKQITPSEMTSTALYFTPGYAPAEQTGMLFNQFGPWTDLYAVGATIFNLLTGKSPLEFDIEEFKEDDLPESNLGLMYKMINWMMQPRRKERPQKAVDAKRRFYLDFVSIGVISIAKEIFNKNIVKKIGTDIDFVKEFNASKEQINKFQKEIEETFGVNVEGYPMTHDMICVCIWQALGWDFDFVSDVSQEVTDEEVDEWNNLVKEQNKILEERDEETVLEGGNKEDNNMTVQEMVALINSDNKKGLETVRGMANSGNADAQLLVGIMHKMGVGGEEHQSDAAYYFRMAAEQGLASAQTNLGKCYLAGDGVQEDDKKAFEWFEKAAEQGDAEGQWHLGRCFEQGWGTHIDKTKAFLWYKKAAEQGNARGQFFLGACYEDGIGVEKDEYKAFVLYKKAAEQDDLDGLLYLGACYTDGIGVTKNSYEATKWYKKAAEKGHPVAQFFMGIKYKDGDGVEVNLKEARSWLQKSADQGYEDAQQALSHLKMQSTDYKNKSKEDESTIIERKPQKEEVNTSYTNSNVTSSVGRSSTTQDNRNSTIGWVVGIAIAIIIGFFVYSNQDNSTLDSSNSNESNSSISSQQNQASSPSPIQTNTVTKTKESDLIRLIANKVGKYPYEVGLSDNKEFSRRFSSLIGSSKYSSFKKNNILEIPIKRYDNSGKYGVHFFDKDEQYIYYIIYDKSKDNLTVIMMENGVDVSSFSYAQEKTDQYLIDTFNEDAFNN